MTTQELTEIKALLEDIRVELIILNKKIPQIPPCGPAPEVTDRRTSAAETIEKLVNTEE